MSLTIITILWGVILLLCTIIGFLVRNKITEMESQIANLKKDCTDISIEIHEFKFNYIDRFEKVIKLINEGNLNTVKQFSELRLLIEQNKH